MSNNSSVIEVQLLRWNEGPNGRTVTFLLHEDTVQHPFRGLRTGPSNGQRLAIACSLIADDETTTPHEPPSQAPEKPASGGNGTNGDKHRLSRQAALCCQDARFRRFLVEELGLSVSAGPLPDSEAADYVRLACGVASRSELDTDTAGAAKWRELHGRYIAWREAP